MGQVTGYTAERMKAIEDASIVNGDIDSNGHLILTRFDESIIDAGVILTSPKVVTSATRPTGADLFDGLIIYETDTKQYWTWNNTAWVYLGGAFFCTAATRPAAPFAGMRIYETDTKREYVYTGSVWSYRCGGTNPTYFFATNAVDQNMNGSGWTKINLPTEHHDPGGNYNVATSEFTIPEGGIYSLAGYARIAIANNPQNALLGIYKNGVDMWEMHGTEVTIRGGVSGDPWGFVVNVEWATFVTGDVLTLRFWNGQANVCVATGGFARFHGRKIA